MTAIDVIERGAGALVEAGFAGGAKIEAITEHCHLVTPNADALRATMGTMYDRSNRKNVSVYRPTIQSE
ncbi:MAG: hypothetical protein AAGA75_03290 [Cyanobacteria bacterium P01_E01_bin.6]